MSAASAFADELFNTTESSLGGGGGSPQVFTESTPVEVEEKPSEEFIYDFDVTVESRNLFEVIAAAVTSYESQVSTL